MVPVGMRGCIVTLRILDAIEDELKKDPFIGKELKGQFATLFSYRIGKYRVIYTIVRNTIIILIISHRKDVYK